MKGRLRFPCEAHERYDAHEMKNGDICKGGEFLAEDALDIENALLRELLKEQWESNHAEHCSSDWPHPVGRSCHWPLPLILQNTERPPEGSRSVNPETGRASLAAANLNSDALAVREGEGWGR